MGKAEETSTACSLFLLPAFVSASADVIVFIDFFAILLLHFYKSNIVFLIVT